MIDFKKTEIKWQKKWEDNKIFEVKEDTKKKFYCLEMYPYPSGSGLHMGHAFNYTIGDIYSRFKRMNGFNVLYPMGYDSFGLPAESAAIKAGVHPKKFTDEAVANFIKQQKALGLSYTWERMVSSCNPEYYKWNQYFFLKFFKNKLVYRKKAPVNWCLECDTVLANEQVHNGKCWRHTDNEVEQKNLEQWFIKTTKYAEELLDCVDSLEWPDRIKIMQKNWIGRSKGVILKFDVVNEDNKKIDIIETFTTRIDTGYGITYLVLAAEHPKVAEWAKDTKYEDDIKRFVKAVKKQTVIERTAEGKEKNGLFLGTYFINPFTNEKCPIWVADYALYEYGTGAVMAVPTHDQRDFEFAKKYNLPLKVVISPNHELNPEQMVRAFSEPGVMVNSGKFNGMQSRDAIEKMAEFAEKKGFGKKTINYKLKDWLVSRQRYWGTPIPMIHCKDCGVVAVPEKDLPVLLPENVEFGKGNPLETNKRFVKVQCPECGEDARRETDTMDTFFDSSWYFLRYCDSKNKDKPFDKDKAEYWMNVDQYIGGAEHACMHLIYARFFTKALRDLGMININEPFKKLFNQGMLHGSDGFVMSKSRGNVILPEVISEKYGIDTVRFFLVSIASSDKDLEWSDSGIEGSSRFISKLIKYYEDVKVGESSKKVESKLNKAIKGITEDIEEFRYNFAIIKIRELLDALDEEASKDTLEKVLKLIHPICPHLTEELWEKLGNKTFLSLGSWPEYDESKIDLKAETKEKIVQDVTSDIRQVLELIKIEPKRITIIIAPEWKFEFMEKFKKIINTTRDVKDIISKIIQTDLKQYGQEISKLVPSLLKDASKIPEIVLNQDIEHETLSKAKLKLNKIFLVEVDVIKNSKHPKVKQAMPGKPAIVVE